MKTFKGRKKDFNICIQAIQYLLQIARNNINYLQGVIVFKFSFEIQGTSRKKKIAVIQVIKDHINRISLSLNSLNVLEIFIFRRQPKHVDVLIVICNCDETFVFVIESLPTNPLIKAK